MAARRTRSTTQLSVVPPDVKAPARRKKPPTVVESVEMTERDVLVATRRTIAEQIDAKPPAHALAGLVRELLGIDGKIRAIDERESEEAKSDAAEVEDGAFDAETV